MILVEVWSLYLSDSLDSTSSDVKAGRWAPFDSSPQNIPNVERARSRRHEIIFLQILSSWLLQSCRETSFPLPILPSKGLQKPHQVTHQAMAIRKKVTKIVSCCEDFKILGSGDCARGKSCIAI